MGNFLDHAYFCKGDKASVEKARKSIERFQKKNAALSGNGNCDFSASPPEFDSYGRKSMISLTWDLKRAPTTG